MASKNYIGLARLTEVFTLLKNKLHKVAFSGSYNDLDNKPTIPTVNDGTLTIQQNGTTVGTFSANQSGDTTVNLTGGGGGDDAWVYTTTLSDSDDLDNLTTVGNYSAPSTGLPLNKPSDAPNTICQIKVESNPQQGGTVWQTYTTADSGIPYTYRRRKFGGSWGDWYRVVTDKPVFTEASTRANIASGDTFATILGKIKKWFTDIPNVFVAKTGDSSLSGTFAPTSDKGASLGSSGHSFYYNYLYRILNCLSIDSSTDGSQRVALPGRSGTMALTSDIPTNTNQLTNGAGFITSAGSCAYATQCGMVGDANNSDKNSTNGNGWYSIAGAKNVMDYGWAPLAINWYWGIDIRTREIAYTRINGYQIITAETIGSQSVNYANSAGSATDQTARNTANAALPKAGGTMTGAINFANANMFINGNGANNWMDLYATGGITYKTQWHDFKTTAGAWNTISALGVLQQSNSSRRVKENIKDITEDEAKRLLNVRIVSFDYKPGKGFGDGDERKGKFGVIAEEVDETFPYVVNYDLDSNHQPIKSSPSGVNYDRFIPHLIKMVQMQQAEIDELKAEIALLKGEIK